MYIFFFLLLTNIPLFRFDNTQDVTTLSGDSFHVKYNLRADSFFSFWYVLSHHSLGFSLVLLESQILSFYWSKSMQRLSSLGLLLIFTDCFLSVIQFQMMSYLPLVFPVPVSLQESEILRARGSRLLSRKSRG